MYRLLQNRDSNVFHWGNVPYRYTFNSQEKDPEIAEGIYSAKFWEYDSRLGRRWNVDPVVKVWESSYATFNSCPILVADPHGDDGDPKNQSAGKMFAGVKKGTAVASASQGSKPKPATGAVGADGKTSAPAAQPSGPTGAVGANGNTSSPAPQPTVSSGTVGTNGSSGSTQPSASGPAPNKGAMTTVVPGTNGNLTTTTTVQKAPTEFTYASPVGDFYQLSYQTSTMTGQHGRMNINTNITEGADLQTPDYSMNYGPFRTTVNPNNGTLEASFETNPGMRVGAVYDNRFSAQGVTFQFREPQTGVGAKTTITARPGGYTAVAVASVAAVAAAPAVVPALASAAPTIIRALSR